MRRIIEERRAFYSVKGEGPKTFLLWGHFNVLNGMNPKFHSLCPSILAFLGKDIDQVDLRMPN